MEVLRLLENVEYKYILYRWKSSFQFKDEKVCYTLKSKGKLQIF